MTDFERIRAAICWLFACLVLMAAGFMFDVLRGGSPITPELYGSRVYAIDARAWAGYQMLSCVIAAVGALRGGMLGAWMTMLGGVAAAAMFAFFARMAYDAPLGTLAFYGSAFLTTPLAALSAISAYNHIRGAK